MEFNCNRRNKDNAQDYCKDCVKQKNIKKRNRFNGLYSVWQDMKKRCYNPRYKGFKYYGAKGIRMYGGWRDSFLTFWDWAKDKHKKGLEIDRIDNTKGYYPENCRFVTHLENMRNNSFTKLNTENVKTIKFLLKNRTLTFKEIGKRFKVTDSTIRSINYGRTWA